MKKLFLLLCAVGGLVGCSGPNSTGIENLSCPTAGTTLTYATYGQAFFNDHCLECHDTRNPTFTSQTAIQAHVDDILQEAVYTDAMPEDGDLTIEQRRELGEWLACGAP